jgi:hypothetical protein
MDQLFIDSDSLPADAYGAIQLIFLMVRSLLFFPPFREPQDVSRSRSPLTHRGMRRLHMATYCFVRQR